MFNKVTTKYADTIMGIANYALHDKKPGQGIADYVLTDKKTQGDRRRGLTDERVGFVVVRNLPTKSGKMAAKMMAYTAMERDALKKANGVTSRGRKAKGPFVHITHSWHPDFAPHLTQEDMVEFADSVMKRIGLQNNQYFIVEHTDTDHPHIHIAGSRIDPSTGKMVSVYYDQNKLSTLAAKHVEKLKKKYGLTGDYCPRRQINADFRDEQRRKRKGERIAIRDKQPARNIRDLGQLSVNDNTAGEALLSQQKQGAATIFAARDRLRDEQDKEWHEFERRYKQEIADLKSDRAGAIRRAMHVYNNHYREELRDQRARHRREQEAFADEEKLAFATVRRTLRLDYRTLFRRYEIERRKTGRSLLQAVFRVMGDAGIRLQDLQERQRREVQAIKRQKRREEKRITREIEQESGRRLASRRRGFLADRERLIAKHEKQDAAISLRWEDHTAKFSALWDKLKAPERRKRWEAGDLAKEMADEMRRAQQNRRGRGV